MDKKAIAVIGGFSAFLSAILFKLIDHVGMTPLAAAHEAELVDKAFNGMFMLTIPIYALVVCTVVYCLWVFRARSPKDEGAKFSKSRGYFVEAIWVLVSLMLTLGLAAFGTDELRALQGGSHADLDVQVTASQFSWEFYYPKYDFYGSRLFLPEGKRVRIILTSQDVVHSFWVPEFRVKQDVVPGKVIKMYTTPTQPGEYILRCAELCGVEHTDMTSYVQVVPEDEFESTIQSANW